MENGHPSQRRVRESFRVGAARPAAPTRNDSRTTSRGRSTTFLFFFFPLSRFDRPPLLPRTDDALRPKLTLWKRGVATPARPSAPQSKTVLSSQLLSSDESRRTRRLGLRVEAARHQRRLDAAGANGDD